MMVVDCRLYKRKSSLDIEFVYAVHHHDARTLLASANWLP